MLSGTSEKITKYALASCVLIAVVFTTTAAKAQKPDPSIPPGLSTPDKVDTTIGTLEFKDGAPSAATVQKVYDNLLYVRGVDAFMNSFFGCVGLRDSKGLPQYRCGR